MKKRSKILLFLLVTIGFIFSIYYLSWWVKSDKIYNFGFIILAAGALFHIISQVVFLWIIYLRARYPESKNTPDNLKVDIFLPIYDEPKQLIEKALISASNVKYPHTTYLIDDGNNQFIKTKAESLGAVYIRRNGNKDYKAGNINNALKYSDGDYIAIFDVDHLPNEDYLDKSLGYFSDPEIGVVQVALDHYNHNTSYVAEACCRMNDDFFGTTMFGMDGLNSAVVFGSNSIFRREALIQLGGYKPGLAEDLNTSIHLHAAGWKSAYVPQILAKGLVPEDLSAFFKQQFKWARGVFETLFVHYPKLFFKLEPGHHISYVNRMTYYLAGLVVIAHIIASFFGLINFEFQKTFEEYLTYSFPLLTIFFVIQVYFRKLFKIKDDPPGLNLKGIILVLGTWPVYTSAFLSALLRINIPFIPTPKERKKSSVVIILPQILASILILISITYNLIFLHFHSSIVIGFSVLLVFLHYGVFFAYIESIRATELSPQVKVKLNRAEE